MPGSGYFHSRSCTEAYAVKKCKLEISKNAELDTVTRETLYQEG